MLEGYFYTLEHILERATRHIKEVRQELGNLLDLGGTKGAGSNRLPEYAYHYLALAGTRINDTSEALKEMEALFHKIRAATSSGDRSIEIEKPSLSMPPQEWKFVQDEDLRAILARDYEELGELLRVRAPKSTVILVGSILEAVLVAVLAKQETRACTKFYELYSSKKPMERWTLQELATVSSELGILGYDLRRHADMLRDYRNLVHPMVEYRRRSVIDEDMVTILLTMLSRTLRFLSENHYESDEAMRT